MEKIENQEVTKELRIESYPKCQSPPQLADACNVPLPYLPHPLMFLQRREVVGGRDYYSHMSSAHEVHYWTVVEDLDDAWKAPMGVKRGRRGHYMSEEVLKNRHENV